MVSPGPISAVDLDSDASTTEVDMSAVTVKFEAPSPVFLSLRLKVGPAVMSVPAGDRSRFPTSFLVVSIFLSLCFFGFFVQTPCVGNVGLAVTVCFIQ